MKSVDAMMRQAVAENYFPGAQLLVSKGNHIVVNQSYGLANIYTGQKVTQDTFFDLASLTKPLATSLAVMLLVQEGRLKLEQTLSSIFPVLIDTPKAGIRIQDLLCHASGLPDYRPYYTALNQLPMKCRKSALHDRLMSEPLIYKPGEATLYSDIGFMFLEWVVEEISGTTLDSFVHEKIYNPLGISDLFYIVGHRHFSDKKFAATEECPWRQTLISGCVHDDNAYVMGGVSGHAGLFGTTGSVHAILLELLNLFHDNIAPVSIFRPDMVRLFLSRKPYRVRALGFDVPSPTGSSSGEGFSRDRTVGHLGFTGTSFWMDLDQHVIVILLTNRIHPTRKNERIKTFRPLLHNQVMKELKRVE